MLKLRCYNFFFIFSLLTIFSVQPTGLDAKGIPGEFSGEAIVENRWYPEKGNYGNGDQTESSLILIPQYSYSWDDDRRVVTIIPFAVISDPDTQKTHLDIREASYLSAYENFELRVGISKVFWGVTETHGLVDVVNQTDVVLLTADDDKLGQPMFNFTLVTSLGNIDFFVLPYFRERTFAGSHGRFRGPLLIDTDNPLYESKEKEKHIDFASRYSSTIGGVDLGISGFKGTDREPFLVINSTGTALQPYYAQMTQLGLDVQYTIASWLLKFEGITKSSKLQADYSAGTAGFEYTFSNIKNTGLDIGLLTEYLYESRSEKLATFYNHTFLGSRIVLNDEKSFEFLYGFIFSNDDGKLVNWSFESSRRIDNNWKWQLEASVIVEPKPTDLLATFKDDDFFQFTIKYYF